MSEGDLQQQKYSIGYYNFQWQQYYNQPYPNYQPWQDVNSNMASYGFTPNT